MKTSATHFLHTFRLTVGQLLFGALAALLFAAPTKAATRLWNGSLNGNFSTSANWVGNVAPVAGDDLVFQTGVTRLLVTNNFSPNRAFNSLIFQGSNYFVRGNSLLLSNGITSVNPVGSNIINVDIEVRASQFWEATGATASLDINGDVDLVGGSTLTVRASTGDFFVSGVIRGTGNLVKTNVGTLRLDGIGTNTYSGFTRFDGGVLELAKSSAAIPGVLSVGDGNGLLETDVLRLFANDQIADTSAVTVRNSGLLDFNGRTDSVGSLTLSGGHVETGAGLLILNGDLTTLSATNSSFINGRLSLGDQGRTFDVQSGAASIDLQINASISSDGTLFVTPGFTKTGGGSLQLTATNTYTGTTTINEGQVSLSADRALGATLTPLGIPAGTVVNKKGNLFLSNVQVTNESLTINSDNAGGAFNTSGASVWTGSILLNTNCAIANTGTLLLSGEISGTAGFTKLGSGTLTLTGTNQNTYSGMTMVRDGTLLVGKNTPEAIDAALSGPLVIGEDEQPEDTDVVRFLACCQVPADTDITLNASGLLNLDGFGVNVRNLVFNGGDIDAPTPGSILPTGDLTVNRNTNSQAVISGRMSVLGNPTINATGHFFSPDLQISAQLFGLGGITKNGVGEIGLSGANSYSGVTTINDGIVRIQHASALGTAVGHTVVNSGAVLLLLTNVAVLAENLTLAGVGQDGWGALSSSVGSNSWAGNVTLSGDAVISVDVGDFLHVGGVVSGSFDITKTGTGTLQFAGAGANSFDAMSVNAGTLLLDKLVANGAGLSELSIGDGAGTDIVRWLSPDQVGDGVPIHIATSGILDLNDENEITGAIDGAGLIDLGNGTGRVTIGSGSSSYNGLIVGTGSLFKLGSGTWTLTGNNTYSGATTVSAGTLVVNGSQPRSAVTVNGTATLKGGGVIGNLLVFGTVAPGGSAGILTSSNIAFAAQGHYVVELNGSAVGTGYDQLDVRGTNQLGGATLHVATGPGFAPVEGERFTIINNDSSEAIVGAFNGLPNGSIIAAGGLQFRVGYSELFLNDVTLTVTNTALQLGIDPIVTTGNGNGDVEPGECNLLHIVLSNKISAVVSGVSATLSTTNSGVTITQPTSTYPNLPANGVRTNTTPFQISTSPTLPCGTNIDLYLTVDTAANGTFTVPIRVFTGAAGPLQRFNRSGAQPIPDFPGSALDSTITVAGLLAPVHHIGVSLHLSHTADDNLDISIEGPDGTVAILSADNGGTMDDYGTSCLDADRTTFIDSAAVRILDASAPFRGTFRPQQPLAAFRRKTGSAVNGTWHLRILVDGFGGIGALHCWSLFVYPTLCPPGGGICEQCLGCPVRLSIARDPASDEQVLLQWSTAAVGYNLISGTLLQNPPNTFMPIGPAPVVVNSKFTVTNVVGGGSRFYELRKP